VSRRYFLWMRLSRLALGAFIFLTIVVVLWLVPFSPAGMDTADYTPQLAFTVYLLAGTSIVGLLVLSFQELARRNRQVLSAWATVYDEATGLHNRSYFYDRLNLECDRGANTPEPFSIIVLQLHSLLPGKTKPPLTNAALKKVAELINSVTHTSDLVGMLSGSELAVLAIRVDRERRHLLQGRLEKTVSTALPDLIEEPGRIDVRSGGATYGVDGTQAGGLIQAARTNAALAVRQHVKSA
jgi:GGDEF domain-containing protein